MPAGASLRVVRTRFEGLSAVTVWDELVLDVPPAAIVTELAPDVPPTAIVAEPPPDVLPAMTVAEPPSEGTS